MTPSTTHCTRRASVCNEARDGGAGHGGGSREDCYWLLVGARACVVGKAQG